MELDIKTTIKPLMIGKLCRLYTFPSLFTNQENAENAMRQLRSISGTDTISFKIASGTSHKFLASKDKGVNHGGLSGFFVNNIDDPTLRFTVEWNDNKTNIIALRSQPYSSYFSWNPFRNLHLHK